MLTCPLLDMKIENAGAPMVLSWISASEITGEEVVACSGGLFGRPPYKMDLNPPDVRGCTTIVAPSAVAAAIERAACNCESNWTAAERIASGRVPSPNAAALSRINAMIPTATAISTNVKPRCMQRG